MRKVLLSDGKGRKKRGYTAALMKRAGGILKWGGAGLAVVILGACTGTCGSSTTPVTPTPTPAPTYSGYVLNFGDGTMTPFALASGVAGKPITVGAGNKVWALAVTPDGKTAYVAEDNASGGDKGLVQLINLSQGTLSPMTITIPAGPKQMVMAPDGKTAYLVDINLSTVTPIDIASNTLGVAIPIGNPALGSQVYGLAIAKDGKTAYISNFGADVTPIDLATKQAGTPIAVNGSGILALSPDGKTLYASVVGSVVAVNLSNQTVGTPFPIGFRPSGMVVSPDGKTLYVTNYSKMEVVPVDIASAEAAAAIASSPAAATGTPSPTASATPAAPLPGLGTPILVGNEPVGIAIGKDFKSV
jgi:DNA-binding beta-propeller fold protein YncE